MCANLVSPVWYFALSKIVNKINQGGDDSTMKRLVTIGVSTSILFYLIGQSLVVLTSLRAPTDVKQHRMYLTSAFPYLLITPLTVYIPERFYAGIIGPSFIISWLGFHQEVGFMNSQSVCCGINKLLFGYFFYRTSNVSEFKIFKAQEALDAEREFLEAMQSTLHGISPFGMTQLNDFATPLFFSLTPPKNNLKKVFRPPWASPDLF